MAPYSRVTGQPFGILRVLAGSTFALTGELLGLTGGSNKYEWAVEQGVITAEGTLKVKEYPNALYEVFLGKAPTSNAAETSGSVTTITNKKGSTVVATDGIASIDLKSGSSADVKFASYVVVAVTGTTVDVYALSDVDGSRGTDFTFQDDVGKITSTPLTIVQSSTVEIPGTGLELTGDGGTIGMTAGDTATFTSRAINTGSMDVTVGATNDTIPEIGILMVAQQRSGGQMFEIDVKKATGIGLPHNMDENTFSEAEITFKASYDSVLNSVFSIRSIVI